MTLFRAMQSVLLLWHLFFQLTASVVFDHARDVSARAWHEQQSVTMLSGRTDKASVGNHKRTKKNAQSAARERHPAQVPRTLQAQELHYNHNEETAAADQAELDDLGELSIIDLMDMPMDLMTAIANPTFVSIMKEATKKLQGSAIDYRLHMKAGVASVLNTTTQVSDDRFVARLADFFDDAWKVLHAHQQLLEETSLRVENAMPKKLNRTLAPMIDLLASNVGPRIYAGEALRRYAQSDTQDACNSFATLMQDYGVRAKKTANLLNSTAKKIPMLHAAIKKRAVWAAKDVGVQLDAMTKTMPLKFDMKSLLQDLARFAYIEAVVLEETSRDVLDRVGPIVTERLGCTWSSDAAKHSHGSLMSVAVHFVIASSILWTIFSV